MIRDKSRMTGKHLRKKEDLEAFVYKGHIDRINPVEPRPPRTFLEPVIDGWFGGVPQGFTVVGIRGEKGARIPGCFLIVPIPSPAQPT
jgi:hypothetical protein